MRFKHSLKRGALVGFVPFRLEIKERPELNIFPRNVLFAKCKVEEGKTITGSALYKPDLESFKKDAEECSMEYRNIYGGKSWLVIKYNFSKKSYNGEKFVDNKSVAMAFGTDWNMFFGHFTFLGLTNGERCEFTY